mgnify:CR=1 FL=1
MAITSTDDESTYMEIMNTLNVFLKERGVVKQSVFIRDTGLKEATARRLFKDRSVYPDRASVVSICRAYKAQPGDFLRVGFED